MIMFKVNPEYAFGENLHSQLEKELRWCLPIFLCEVDEKQSILEMQDLHVNKIF